METWVYVDNLRMHAYHGVLQQERTVGNDYVITLRVGCPWQKAAETDDVADTVSYAVLVELIKEQMALPSQLLEHVAGRIQNAVTVQFPETTSLYLDIKKIAPPVAGDCDGCGIVLRWNRS